MSIQDQTFGKEEKEKMEKVKVTHNASLNKIQVKTKPKHNYYKTKKEREEMPSRKQNREIKKN